MTSRFGLCFVVACVVIALLCVVTVGDAKVGVNSLPPVQLVAGANMVGWPLLVTVPLTDALGACYPHLIHAESYDANDVADPWEKYHRDYPPFLWDMTAMQYAHGYWLTMDAPCTWTPGVTP